ncbi:unnamed protein product [Eruca vesicaria subsp. sativa]|uniref:Uncharacterized protein n=1 Tax=Eruca vesicaria subsp. sativa TaxID=29727 RepID=A0ABC8M6H7_ERUVS|nr:unnamed protein product [Eruca vesicaria subsp. sativa]
MGYRSSTWSDSFFQGSRLHGIFSFTQITIPQELLIFSPIEVTFHKLITMKHEDSMHLSQTILQRAIICVGDKQMRLNSFPSNQEPKTSELQRDARLNYDSWLFMAEITCAGFLQTCGRIKFKVKINDLVDTAPKVPEEV